MTRAYKNLYFMSLKPIKKPILLQILTGRPACSIASAALIDVLSASRLFQVGYNLRGVIVGIAH